jgi:hypothetical protein
LNYYWNYVAEATKTDGKIQAVGFDTGMQKTVAYNGDLDRDSSRNINVPLKLVSRVYHGYSQIQTPYQSAYQHVQFTIDRQNNIQGSNDFGCTFSGNLTSTEKAYQYVTIKFGEGNCEYRNKTLKGVVYDLNSNSLKVIIRNGDNVMVAFISKNA